MSVISWGNPKIEVGKQGANAAAPQTAKPKLGANDAPQTGFERRYSKEDMKRYPKK